jgi:hypothetical protein
MSASNTYGIFMKSEKVKSESFRIVTEGEKLKIEEKSLETHKYG